MDDARPSLARRALAALILAVVAVLAFRIVLGAITAVFWIVVIVALVIAALWAVATLKSGKRERKVKPSSAAQVPPPSTDDKVAAEMARLQQQLRDQGRL
jgi:Ca2+/Na+ antiporter